MRTLCVVLMLIPVPLTLAQDQARELNVFPTDTVQVTTSSELDPTSTIIVTLTPVPKPQTNPPATPETQSSTVEPECSKGPKSITVDGPSKHAFSLGIPPDICTGRYQLTASRQSAPGTAPKGTNKEEPEINISSPQYVRVNEKPPVVTGIDPKALFRDEPATLVFLGPNSLKPDTDYTVRFADHALPKCPPPQDGQSCFQQDAKASQVGQIKFSLQGGEVLSQLSGKQSVSLVHNGAESAAQTLIVVDLSRTTPRNYALGLTLALVVLIYLLLSAGRKALSAKTDRGSFLLTALFLDEETQTYSLSKCQFYAWTVAAILGYVFFAVAKSIIQGSAVFPDIPGGLPAILLFSAGTSVVATGITSSKGAKGAGEVHPTLADFVTTGGVVAPERLQFVAWTVVGIFTFLTIVFKSDPLTLSDLPSIPSGFLQLMGISSAGYLAGKLARKAGPVVKVLSVANVTPAGQNQNLPNQYLPGSGTVVRQPVLTLNLKGENLDPKANIKVDGQPLRGDMFWITGGTPDPQSGFCCEFYVSLNDADTYLEGTHTLTVVNSDAQAADVVFPIDPMTIDAVQISDVAGGAQPTAVVTGKNFVGPTSAVWQDATGGAPVPIPAVQPESTTKLTVNRPPAATAGSSFKLTLISSVGLRASKKI